MEAALKKLGFIKSDPPYWIKRLDALIWIAYDTSDGFVELRRKNEHLKERSRRKLVKIVLPKPRRTEKDLRKLLEVLE